MKHSASWLSAVAAAVALLAGCSNTPIADTAAPVETRNTTAGAGGTTGSGATSGATPQSQVTTVDLAAQNAAAAAAAAAAAGRVVYFDFDSFTIKDEYKPAIDANARLLTTNKGSHLTVEGHTDERGGREYNLALGQKRAEAVVRSLELLGAGQQQVEAVSFGEERPADAGHDEAAWAKNRRAELKVR